MKKGLKFGCESKLSHRSQSLFQFAKANPDGGAVRTAALGSLALLPPFRCGETSGGARYLRSYSAPQRESRSFFPQEKRRTPAGDTTQQCGRPITQRVIARVKRAEKEPERRYASLLAVSAFPTLFHTACRNKPIQARFSGGFGRRF